MIKTIKKLSDLKSRYSGLSIYIITVVNNKNIKEILQLAEYVKNNLPVDGHGPSPMRGSPYDRYLSSPSYKEWEDVAKKLLEYHEYWNSLYYHKNIKAFLITNKVRYLNSLYTYILRNNRLPVRCQAGRAIAVIEPNGDVKLCELTEVVGNVRSFDYNIGRILLSEKSKKLVKKLKNCACTHACFLNPSIDLDPVAMFKSYFLGRL